MILIVTEEQDVTTWQVCDWLNQMNKPYVIINENTKVQLLKLSVLDNNFQLLVGDVLIQYTDVKSVWFRRGGIFLCELCENPLCISVKQKKHLGIGTWEVLTQRAQRSHGVTPSYFLLYLCERIILWGCRKPERVGEN